MRFHLHRGVDQEDAESFLFLLGKYLQSVGYYFDYRQRDKKTYSAFIREDEIHEPFEEVIDNELARYFNQYFILDRETENFSITYIPGAVIIVEDCEYDAF